MKQLPLPLSTKRLMIRHFEARDRDLEAAISDNPVLFDHLPINPRSEAELDEYVQARLGHKTFEKIGGTVALIIETAESSEYVGSMQLSPSVLNRYNCRSGGSLYRNTRGRV